MQIPESLLYTQDHEWARIEGEIVYVGITDYAQNQLGDIVYVEVETVGEEIEQGNSFGTIEAVKTVADLFMPLSGKVQEVNPKILEKPELINQDPYGEGWIIKIQPTKLEEEKKNLLNAEKYRKLIESLE